MTDKTGTFDWDGECKAYLAHRRSDFALKQKLGRLEFEKQLKADLEQLQMEWMRSPEPTHKAWIDLPGNRYQYMSNGDVLLDGQKVGQIAHLHGSDLPKKGRWVVVGDWDEDSMCDTRSEAVRRLVAGQP